MVNITNLRRLSVLLIVALVAFFIISYQVTLIETKYYVEPAENEALVLSQSNAFVSGSQELGEYIAEGVLPIYPDLFHKLSLLGVNNKLAMLRSISVFSFWLTSVALFFYARQVTRSSTFSALITLLFYGVAHHSLYFMMARPDGLYISFGSLSLIGLGAWLHCKPPNEIFSLATMAVIGMLASLSLLSKQSGLIFFALVIFTLLIRVVRDRETMKSLLRLMFFVGFYLFTALVYYYFSPVSFEFFMNGLSLYASEFSVGHVYKQMIDLFLHYWWLIFVTALLFIDLFSRRKIKETFFWLGIWLIVATMSIKLFSNDAAHFNNYIFVSAAFFFMCSWLWAEFRFKKSSFIILFLGVFTSFFGVYGESEKTKFKSVHEIYKSRMLLNGEIEDSAIFNYVKSNSGEYLSGRADFILYFSDRNIFYEGSVFDAYYNQGREAENENIEKLLAKKREEINDKIEAQFFSGIVLGINGETIKNFPIIKEKYMKLEVQKVESGDWPHDISLWIPVVK